MDFSTFLQQYGPQYLAAAQGGQGLAGVAPAMDFENNLPVYGNPKYGEQLRTRVYQDEDQAMQIARFNASRMAAAQGQQDARYKATEQSIYNPAARAAVDALKGYESISGIQPLNVIKYYDPEKKAAAMPGEPMVDDITGKVIGYKPPREVPVSDEEYYFVHENQRRLLPTLEQRQQALSGQMAAMRRPDPEMGWNPEAGAYTFNAPQAQQIAPAAQQRPAVTQAERDELEALLARKYSGESSSDMPATARFRHWSKAKAQDNPLWGLVPGVWLAGGLGRASDTVRNDMPGREDWQRAQYESAAKAKNAWLWLKNNAAGLFGADRNIEPYEDTQWPDEWSASVPAATAADVAAARRRQGLP